MSHSATGYSSRSGGRSSRAGRISEPPYSSTSSSHHSFSRHHLDSERPSSSGSSNSSSLADAMGELTHSRASHSPPSALNLIGPQDPSLSWLTGTQPQPPMLATGTYQSCPPDASYDAFLTPTASHLPHYPSPSYSSSQLPPSMSRYSNTSYPPQFQASSRSFVPIERSTSRVDDDMMVPNMPYNTKPAEPDVRSLQRQIYELEMMNEQQRIRIAEMESQASQDDTYGLPSPPPSASFQESWERRTVARTRYLCSLNRAGNALCAWHDSRRERRAYPPRHAPPGYLNCGCKYEEALFEESIARHNVGSYHPGENVRMDPALRNPLLKLLQTTYNYKDGDFERDPRTGTWQQGEGHEYWEAKLQSVYTTGRRARDD